MLAHLKMGILGIWEVGEGGGYKSKLALLIFAQTISIPVWYRYGFLLFLAVFEISSAKEHIFDSCKCITYLLGWVLSKISKKPYLYRTGIDMVFSIFSSSNFHGRTQMYSGWSRSIITRAHGVTDWCDIFHRNTTSRAFFPKNHIHTSEV